MHTLETLLQLAGNYAGEAMEDMEYPNKHKVDKARAALQSALSEALAERDEHKENAMRNARIAVTFKAERDRLSETIGRINMDREQLRADRDGLHKEWESHFGERSFGEVVAERDALQGEVAAVKRLLGNIHNNGANWQGQQLIRDYLASSVAMKGQTHD